MSLSKLEKNWELGSWELPNSLAFRAGALKRDIVYDVSIKGVVIGGTARDFDYWFKVVS